MTFPHVPLWAIILLGWWVGMIPAAVIGGRAQRDMLKAGQPPYPDSTVIILVILWPFILAVAPIVAAHLAAQGKKALDAKPKAKGDGKAK